MRARRIVALLCLGVCVWGTAGAVDIHYRLTDLGLQFPVTAAVGDGDPAGARPQAAPALATSNAALAPAQAWRSRRCPIEPPPAAPEGFHAVASNRMGEVLGSVVDLDSEHFDSTVYLRDRCGLYHQLPHAPGAQSSSPTALNDRGWAVGFSDVFPGGSSRYRVAVLWRNDTVEVLQLPGTGQVNTLGSAFDINERGQIIGVYGRGEPDFTTHGYVWKDGAVTAELEGWPFSINNWGWIVGERCCNTVRGWGQVGVRWRNAQRADLNDLIIADDPLKPYVFLESSRSIDDRGRIIASGIDSRFDPSSNESLRMYRLTPVLVR